MKHTPGPWYIRQDRSVYVNHAQPYFISNKPEGDDDYDEDSIWICRCMDSWDDEMKANARLIAAAPEMLEILIEYVAEYNREHEDEDHKTGSYPKRRAVKCPGTFQEQRARRGLI
jgi:hypothetical protein